MPKPGTLGSHESGCACPGCIAWRTEQERKLRQLIDAKMAERHRQYLTKRHPRPCGCPDCIAEQRALTMGLPPPTAEPGCTVCGTKDHPGQWIKEADRLFCADCWAVVQQRRGRAPEEEHEAPIGRRKIRV